MPSELLCTNWQSLVDDVLCLHVAGPWEEVKPRFWVRSIIWLPRPDAPHPCIELDGYTSALVEQIGERWAISGATVFDTLEEAKAEEDRALREDGWILADAVPLNYPRARWHGSNHG